MREIKFRGKRLDNRKWVYGYLCENTYGEICIQEIVRKVINRFVVPSRLHPVNPDTIGQYTGLKDKNGREIYEGDIISGSNGSINGYEWPFKLLIKWNDKKCGFNTPAWGYMDSTHYYEVISNIYDNPELLEDWVC